MNKTVQEYTELFVNIYKQKLTQFGVTDPNTIQTLVTCLTLAAYDFVATIELDKKPFPFKNRGRYGGK